MLSREAYSPANTTDGSNIQVKILSWRNHNHNYPLSLNEFHFSNIQQLIAFSLGRVKSKSNLGTPQINDDAVKSVSNPQINLK